MFIIERESAKMWQKRSGAGTHKSEFWAPKTGRCAGLPSGENAHHNLPNGIARSHSGSFEENQREADCVGFAAFAFTDLQMG
jgi:hypothetical protein